jgi:hypothetical protein
VVVVDPSYGVVIERVLIDHHGHPDLVRQNLIQTSVPDAAQTCAHMLRGTTHLVVPAVPVLGLFGRESRGVVCHGVGCWCCGKRFGKNDPWVLAGNTIFEFSCTVCFYMKHRRNLFGIVLGVFPNVSTLTLSDNFVVECVSHK